MSFNNLPLHIFKKGSERSGPFFFLSCHKGLAGKALAKVGAVLSLKALQIVVIPLRPAQT
ncbi:hypothetical protein DOM22_14915 [Bdellovibrio sp. ZAP7]|nr:hypothetical protein DOM22_14915 [Bdellovibrio sp. ZAP7]